MSDINLTDVNAYFVSEAKAGRLTASMFRTWSDAQVGIIRRSEMRGKKATTNAKKQKSGKSADSASGSKSKGKGSKETPKKAEKPATKKGSSKEAPPTESKADKANKSRMTALVKFNRTLNTNIPQEILEGTWKADARPWLLSEASNDFYLKVNHELRSPPDKSLLPDNIEELSQKERDTLYRKLNYNILFDKVELTGEERDNTKSFIPIMPSRTIPDGYDAYGNVVPKKSTADTQ